MQVELLHDAFTVTSDGIGADVQFIGNGRTGQSCSNKLKYLNLTAAENSKIRMIIQCPPCWGCYLVSG